MGLFGFGKKKTNEEILAEGRAQFESGDLKAMFLTLHGLANKGESEACYYIGHYWLDVKGDARMAKKYLVTAAQANVRDAGVIVAKEYGIREYLAQDGAESAQPVTPEPPKPTPAPAEEYFDYLPMEEVKPSQPVTPEPPKPTPASGRALSDDESSAKLTGMAEKKVEAVPAKSDDELHKEGIDAYQSGDYAAAVAVWRPLAEKGYAKSATSLGVAYQFGNGVETDVTEAAKWYQIATDLGDAGGMRRLGVMYENGEGVEKDLPKSFSLYLKAAGLDDKIAAYYVGLGYYKSLGVEMNLPEALRWYEKSGELGYAKAQQAAGEMYFFGEGTKVNFEKALPWYEKAAEQGLAGSQYKSGVIYDAMGQKDKAKAAFEKAAAQGHEKAKAKLAEIAEAKRKAEEPKPAPASQPKPAPKPGDDLSPEERYEKGMEFFRAGKYDDAFPLLNRACPCIGLRKNKYPDGQAAMGQMYENGRGTEVNAALALWHYKISAQNGDQNGMAGFVRIISKGDTPSLDDCQTALDYAKQLNMNEVSALEAKLAEAKRRAEREYPSYVAELNDGTVQNIFNRCGKPKEDGTVDWDIETLANNRPSIRYLLGQLALVHQGVKEHELDGAFAKKAGGGNWTTDRSILINLLNLGITGAYLHLFKKDGKQFIELKLGKLVPTLSPKDPKFTAWWDGGDGLMLRAQAAMYEEREADALSFYVKAAEKGHVEAQFKAANMYSNGKGTAENQTEALKWYLKAAEQGHAKAQFYAGLMYYAGEGTAVDKAEALKWFVKAAEQGLVEAQYKAACMYDAGLGTAKDQAKALKWFLKAAEQGHAEAQRRAAEKYEWGWGTAVDNAEALRWYLKAAEQGNNNAQFNVALSYENGKGTAVDYAEALRWYLKAAEQGGAVVQRKVAEMYHYHSGAAENMTEAFKWYLKAAEQGDAEAQHWAGYMYDRGQGTAKDLTEAFKWYVRAAEQGNVLDQFRVALMYDEGEGVAKDSSKAFQWYLKAAENDLDMAQYSVGAAYYDGDGTVRDRAKAKMWFEKAAAQGNEDAKEVLRKSF